MHHARPGLPKLRGRIPTAAWVLRLGAALLGPAAAGAQLPPTAGPPLVFDSVTVVDVEHGQLMPVQRVVIAGTRIQAVGPAATVPLPAGAQVVEARDKYLIPGLWDMHVHPLRLTHLFYPLFLANGVTGIRDAGSPVPLDTLLRWRREIQAGTRVGPPRQVLSGPYIQDYCWSWIPFCVPAVPTAGELPMDPRHVLDSLRQAIGADGLAARVRHLVDSLQAAGADMIKARLVTKEEYLAVAAEARQKGIPFGGHDDRGDGAVTALEASANGARIVDHDAGGIACWPPAGDRTDVPACQSNVQQFRRTETWFVPTVIAGGGAMSDDLKKRLGQFWAGTPLPHDWLREAARPVAGSSGPREVLRQAISPLALAAQAGLPMLVGTDVGPPTWSPMFRRAASQPLATQLAQRGILPGFTLHVELAAYVAAGLTPLAALQAATLNPAKMLHATDSLGTVATGKLADLVLLDADPLADITNTTAIEAVVANGRYFDRATLDRILADVQVQAR